MSGDGGTIRSVVSKTIKITPKMPSSFARPYWNPVNDQMETIRRTDGIPRPVHPVRAIWRVLCGQAGQRSHPQRSTTQTAVGAHRQARKRNQATVSQTGSRRLFPDIQFGKSVIRSGATLKRLMPYRFSRIRIVSGNRESSFLPKTVEPK